MQKKQFIHIGRWLVVACAYAYLIYKLATFRGWNDTLQAFGEATPLRWLWLALALLLMPLNQWSEACKWRQLVASLEPMSRREALRQVLYGAAAAFITPWRVGDYPARIGAMAHPEHWKEAAKAAVIGSVMTTVMIICPPALLLVPLVLRRRDLWAAAGWTALRCIIWYSQMALLLWACGLPLSPAQMAIAVPIYYALVTIGPSLPALDAGIRGGWAVLVIGHWAPDYTVQIVVATGLMWLINTVLPVLCSPLLSKKSNQS